MVLIIFSLYYCKSTERIFNAAAPKLLVSAMQGCLNTRLLSQITHMYGYVPSVIRFTVALGEFIRFCFYGV